MHNNQHLVETLVSSEQIFKGGFMQVMCDVVKLPNGALSKREYIKHNGAVAVFAIDQDNNLIMEKQYRHPVQEVMFEIPAGKIDPNEDLLECGKRELLEETGYIAHNWVYLGEILPCIGYSTEKITFFVASELEFSGAKLDEGEFLEVYKQPLDELLVDISAGKIRDGKTLAGLMLLMGHLKRI